MDQIRFPQSWAAAREAAVTGRRYGSWSRDLLRHAKIHRHYLYNGSGSGRNNGTDLLDLHVSGPPGSSVLTIASRVGLDAVQCVMMGQHGKAADDHRHNTSGANKHSHIR